MRGELQQVVTHVTEQKRERLGSNTNEAQILILLQRFNSGRTLRDGSLLQTHS
jgi:hypothetical protein